MIATQTSPTRTGIAFGLLAIVCLFARTSPAQEDAAIRKQLEANGAEVGKAIHNKDVATLQKFWSPQLLVNSPGNNILTRDEVFAALRDGLLDYTKYEITVEAFRTYGDVAVVMGHEVLVPSFGPEAGKTFYRRYTDVLQRTDGSWLMISRQATYTTATDMYSDRKK